MEIKVDVNLHAPELVKAIENLTSIVPVKSQNVRNELPATKEAQKPSVTDVEEVSESATKDKKKSSKVTVSLEEVRAKLAALTQSGKQAEVKALIKKHGGKKLSDIPKDKYPDLLKDAEEI